MNNSYFSDSVLFAMIIANLAKNLRDGTQTDFKKGLETNTKVRLIAC